MTEEQIERAKYMIEHPSEEAKIQANMLNQAIRLYEAADLLIWEHERRMKLCGFKLRHDVKYLFNQMSVHIEKLRFYIEKFAPLYEEAYGKKVGEKFIDIQDSAFKYAIFAMLLGDRADTVDKLNEILDFIQKYPSHGSMKDDVVKDLQPK